MKKALPILAMLLALTSIVVLSTRPGEAKAFPMSQAPELAPGASIAYVVCADLETMLARWKRDELRRATNGESVGKVWMEILTTPVRYGPGLRECVGVLEELNLAEPEWAFLAATKIDAQPLPKLVGGFPYRGKKSDLERAVRRLKERLLAAWPGAKSELTKHGQVEIESMTSPVLFRTPPYMREWCGVAAASSPPHPPAPMGFPAVHLAFCDNWFFVATDRELLSGVLDRYSRKPGAGKGLAEVPDFTRQWKAADSPVDLNCWGRWSIVDLELFWR